MPGGTAAGGPVSGASRPSGDTTCAPAERRPGHVHRLAVGRRHLQQALGLDRLRLPHAREARSAGRAREDDRLLEALRHQVVGLHRQRLAVLRQRVVVDVVVGLGQPVDGSPGARAGLRPCGGGLERRGPLGPVDAEAVAACPAIVMVISPDGACVKTRRVGLQVALGGVELPAAEERQRRSLGSDEHVEHAGEGQNRQADGAEWCSTHGTAPVKSGLRSCDVSGRAFVSRIIVHALSR